MSRFFLFVAVAAAVSTATAIDISKSSEHALTAQLANLRQKKTNTQVESRIYVSMDGTHYQKSSEMVIRAQNRGIWTSLKNSLSKKSKEVQAWFEVQKCNLCQSMIRSMKTTGCTAGVGLACDYAAGVACGVLTIPFAKSVCSGVCNWASAPIVKRCDAYVKAQDFSAVTSLEWCQSKQWCTPTSTPLPCECASDVKKTQPTDAKAPKLGDDVPDNFDADAPLFVVADPMDGADLGGLPPNLARPQLKAAPPAVPLAR